MAFGVRRRGGGMYLPVSWWGKTLQCLCASAIMTALIVMIYVLWFVLDAMGNYFIIAWTAAVTAVLLMLIVLWGMLFVHTITGKPLP